MIHAAFIFALFSFAFYTQFRIKFPHFYFRILHFAEFALSHFAFYTSPRPATLQVHNIANMYNQLNVTVSNLSFRKCVCVYANFV